jgi:hypothetical protein
MENTIFYSGKPIITENEEGFVFNFTKDGNDVDDAIDYGFRIGMSPLSAKKFHDALYLSVDGYEKKYGEIKIKSSEIEVIKKPKPKSYGFK